MAFPPSLYDETMARLYGQSNLANAPPPGTPGRQPSPIQPLTPQDESTVLGKIGGSALSGLGYVGGSLGKAFGGRAIRGLLGGHPEELLSAIPFSDTLGITDPANEVTGAELLGNKQADFLSPEGLGGMGAEILLDPATYLSFGGNALSKLGVAAKKAGVLPKTTAGRIAGLAAGSSEAETLARQVAGGIHGPMSSKQIGDVAGQALGGHMGIGLPFGGNAATFDLSGAGNMLSKAMDYVPGGHAIKGLGTAAWDSTQSMRSGLTALFDKSVQGRTNPVEQQIMRDKFSTPYEKMMVQSRQDLRPLVEEMHAKGLINQPGGALIGDVLENAKPAGDLQGLKDTHDALMKQLLGEQMDSLLPARPLAGQKIVGGEGVGNEMGYLTRQLAKEEFSGKGTRPKAMAPSAQQARLEGNTGMTRSHFDTLRNTDMTGMSPASIEEKIRTDFLGLPQDAVKEKSFLQIGLNNARAEAKAAQDTLTAAEHMANYGPLHPQLATDSAAATQRLATAQAAAEAATAKINDMDVKLAQASDLAKYKVEDKVPIFNHPGEDIVEKVVKDRKRALMADAFHTAVVNMAVTKDEAGPGGLSFLEALQRGGLAPEGNRFMQKTKDAFEYLGKNPMDLEHMHVKPEDLAPMLKWMEGTRTPSGLAPFINAWDSITNLTKSWQTAAWPANWSRNFMTDQFMHWVHDGSSSSIGMFKDLADAKTLHSGGMLADAHEIPGLTHLSPDQANMEVHRMIVDRGVTGQGKLLTDTVGLPGEGVRIEDLIPGKQRAGPVDAYKNAMTEGTWNPLDVRGVGGRTETANKFVKGGQDVNASLSEISRIQTFIGKLRQGFAPEEAMKSVVAAHYDFSQLSSFEKDFMKRVIPFYSWARNNVPTVLQEMATNPGGKLGNVVKASGRARGAEPGFLPKDIGEGVAMPIGQEEDGTKRFLSHTGLPFEDLAQMTTGADYLGMLNPLIKAPMELATGKQFFTGRDLHDLHSDTGSTLLDEVFANSPAGRLNATRRTLSDDRKDPLSKIFNIASGMHVSDVDMEKARNNAVRDYVTEQLRGSPNIGQHLDLYPKKDQLANLTPQELMALRLQATRDREQKKKIGVRT